MFIRIEQAAWRRCGDPACVGQPQDDRARNEVFFSGAITSALGHDARAVRDAGRVGDRDVKSMLAFARAIAHQCSRRAEANRIGGRRHQPGRACPYALRHRDCGVGTGCLFRCKPEKCGKRQRVVGNLRLDQQPRAAGHTKQLADRPTTAAGDRERSLAAGGVQCGDQLLPRSVRRGHGACGPKLKSASRMVKGSSGGVNRVRASARSR